MLFTRRKIPPPQLPRDSKTVYRSVRRMTARTLKGNGSQWSRWAQHSLSAADDKGLWDNG
eukprot:COSAG04_NODE_794_length_10264_cov_35.102804_13_plen_60_part_00